jgi:hypothetical protein
MTQSWLFLNACRGFFVVIALSGSMAAAGDRDDIVKQFSPYAFSSGKPVLGAKSTLIFPEKTDQALTAEIKAKNPKTPEQLSEAVVTALCNGKKPKVKIQNDIRFFIPHAATGVPLDDAAKARTAIIEKARKYVEAFYAMASRSYVPHLTSTELEKPNGAVGVQVLTFPSRDPALLNSPLFARSVSNESVESQTSDSEHVTRELTFLRVKDKAEFYLLHAPISVEVRPYNGVGNVLFKGKEPNALTLSNLRGGPALYEVSSDLWPYPITKFDGTVGNAGQDKKPIMLYGASGLKLDTLSYLRANFVLMLSIAEQKRLLGISDGPKFGRFYGFDEKGESSIRLMLDDREDLWEKMFRSTMKVKEAFSSADEIRFEVFSDIIGTVCESGHFKDSLTAQSK